MQRTLQDRVELRKAPSDAATTFVAASMSDEMRAIAERVEAENRARREKFEDDLDRWMEEARSVGRDALYRITALSASIVAFSATLLSIEELNFNANEGVLAASWCLFAAVVVLAPAVVALEARAKFVVAWRSQLPQNFDDERRPTQRELLKLFLVAAYSVALRPRNLIYGRDTDYDPEKPTEGMWMNFRMILLLHKIWDFALAIELLVWALFAAGMVVLVVALFP